MIGQGSYRTVLTAPGAPGLVIAGFLGRLPMAMRALGLVVFVSSHSGSYVVAGVAAGGSTACQALCAPFWAKRAELGGIRWTTLVSGPTVFGITCCTLWAVESGAPNWSIVALASLMGAFAIPVSAFSRSLWRERIDGHAMDSALALEGVQDEISYVFGPALVVGLDTGVVPGSGLFAAGCLHLFGCVAIGLTLGRPSLLSSLPEVSPDAGLRAILGTPGVIFLLSGYSLMGVMFGALDIGVVASAELFGFTHLSGWLLSSLALGSTVAGIAYGAHAWNSRHGTRMALFSVGLAGALALVGTFADMPLGLFICLMFAGLCVAPIMIAANSAMIRLSPVGGIAGLALLASSISVGMAFGSSLAGYLIDYLSASAGFACAAACAVGSAALFWVVPEGPE